MAVGAAEAEAALFDAAEYLQPGKFSLGINGDLLLNNPTGEAAEARLKTGINEMVNIQGVVGAGSRNRKFRAGAISNVNFFADSPGSLGITLLVGVGYVKRAAYSGLQILTGPLVHHTFKGWDNKPLNIFLGIPFTMELHGGSYTTGSQLAFGALWDMGNSGTWFLHSEAALSLRRSESYVSLGAGMRLGASGGRAYRREQREQRAREEDRYEERDSAPRKKYQPDVVNPEVETIESDED